MAFLDGAPPERLCEPIVDYVEARGGSVRMNSGVQEILLDEDGSRVEGLKLRGGEILKADAYVSTMPVHIMNKLMPEKWRSITFFVNISKLKAVPVINIHLWFDRKLLTVDHLLFSRSPLLSVYADMSMVRLRHPVGREDGIE